MDLTNPGIQFTIRSCPVRGTYEIIEKGNELFREHPAYGSQKNLPFGVSDELLKESHIGNVHSSYAIPPWKTESSRIFRQGYEFLEIRDNPVDVRVGLNFVSFQNSPKRLYGSLGHNSSGASKTSKMPSFEQFVSVRAAGIFLVPPFAPIESFPGASIFNGIDSEFNRDIEMEAKEY